MHGPFLQTQSSAGRVRIRRLLTCLIFCLLCSLCLSAGQVRAELPVRAALMVNMSSGRILYQKNADTPIPPASLTKIMTSFLIHDAVAQGRLSLRSKVRIPPQAARTGGSTMRLRSGERVTVERLLQGMIITSGNDAATALALRAGGGRMAGFVQAMNTKAANLGMKRTRFRNPTGLPANGQITTARDMMRLCLAYLSRHPGALRIHSQSLFWHRGREMTTTNPFLGSRGVDGLKTGLTQKSGYNIILTAGRGDTRLLIIVLGGRSRAGRDSAAAALLRTGLAHPGSARVVQQKISQAFPKKISQGKKRTLKRRGVSYRKRGYSARRNSSATRRTRRR